MIYVMSDLHGEYEKYRAMLEKIHFSDADDLYVLGDVVDRGPCPARLLQDMAKRSNVWPLLGNHELMALDLLPVLMAEAAGGNQGHHLSDEVSAALKEWMEDGGNTTLADFEKLTDQQRHDLLDYMKDFERYAMVDAGGRTFFLVHAGLGNYAPGKKLDAYTLPELTFTWMDYGRDYFEDASVYVVTGHTPTLSITGKAEIYHQNRNICIDCGVEFPQGRLACLCLDTMEEFYV